MIHDPTFPVTCDADGCNAEIEVSGEWTLGGYNLEDNDPGIEREGWVTRDGKHYCWDHAGDDEGEA